MLVLTPTHVLDFEVEAAAADLTAAVKALAAARGVPFPVDRIPTLYLQVLTPPSLRTSSMFPPAQEEGGSVLS
jgi:hypothetical protein